MKNPDLAKFVKLNEGRSALHTLIECKQTFTEFSPFCDIQNLLATCYFSVKIQTFCIVPDFGFQICTNLTNRT